MSCTFSSRALIDRVTLKKTCKSSGCPCKKTSTFQYTRRCCTADNAPVDPVDPVDPAELDWVEFPLTIRGTTTDPSKATTTTVDKALYYIQGKIMRLRYIYRTENPGTATVGSGAYSLELPEEYVYEYEQNEVAGSANLDDSFARVGTVFIFDGLLRVRVANETNVGLMSNTLTPLNTIANLYVDATVRLQ